jgi:hypothetical protein
MSKNALRIISASLAIAAVAVVSLAHDTPPPTAGLFDPSVPSAWEVFHSNDGRSEGNVEDKSY